MFLKRYNLYENKLSKQLSDDNPYKKKLIQMETPAEKHPIYTGVVWGLLIYSWIFFIFLFYKQINLSALYNLKMAISTGSIIFVTLSIWICYKKDYLVTITPIYRRNAYIIFAFSIIFSILLETADSGSATKTEIIETFFFFYTINPKSYIALAIISYIALGVATSYYSCPYEVYRGFYSVHQTYKEYKTERIFINKGIKFLFLSILAFFPFLYAAFNPAKDSFASLMKNVSIFAIFGTFPLCISILIGKKYDKCFERATKLRKETKDD